MTVLIPACADPVRLADDNVVEEAELAAAAFLARYRGRAVVPCVTHRGDAGSAKRWTRSTSQCPATDAWYSIVPAPRPRPPPARSTG